jgi:hypothetical protein
LGVATYATARPPERGSVGERSTGASLCDSCASINVSVLDAKNLVVPDVVREGVAVTDVHRAYASAYLQVQDRLLVQTNPRLPVIVNTGPKWTSS